MPTSSHQRGKHVGNDVETNLNEGFVLIEVDDLLEGVTPEHRDRMEKFYKKYKCGKRKKIMD